MPFDPIKYRPPPPPPAGPRHPMSKRQESILIWCLCLWLAGLFIAPIGGSSVVHLVLYLFR